MNGTSLALMIISIVVLSIILYHILKPYFIKYDSTLCVNGGLGSGKTLTCVKIAIVLIRKMRLKYYVFGNWKIAIVNQVKKIVNYFHLRTNKKKLEKAKKLNKDITTVKLKKIYTYKPKIKKPMLYSNIPIHFKKHLLGRKREWAIQLEAPHLLNLKQMREYSVVFIDELPQFINQFNWNQELIQKNVNEFITFFRHYIGGYLIVNAQAIDDVVVQIRRKLNQATWCFDFHKWGWPIPLFYTIRMCDMVLSDQVQTMSTTYIEENTKLHFGLFPARKTYDTRCYSERYKNVYINEEKMVQNPTLRPTRPKKLKTNKVLRLVKYKSPLDDNATEQQKQQQWEKGEQTWKN